MTREASLSKRLEATERRLAALERQAARRDQQLIQRTRVRLGITMGGSYPSSPANVLPVVFIDATFTEEAGEQTLTRVNHSDESQVFAYSLCGTYLAAGSLVVVLEQNRRHFIVSQCGGGASFAMARLDDALACLDECAAVKDVVGACNEVPAAVCNHFGLQGEEDDAVLLAKVPLCGDEAYYGCYGNDSNCEPSGSSQWVVAQVVHKPICVPVKGEIRTSENGAKCLLWGKANFPLMFSDRQLYAQVIGNICCDDPYAAQTCGCVELDMGRLSESCCAPTAACGDCPTMPPTLHVTIENDCGVVSFPLSLLTDCGGPCSTRYEGSGTFHCRDQSEPYGPAECENVLAEITLCVQGGEGSACEISLTLTYGDVSDTVTATFSWDSCEPLLKVWETNPPGDLPDCGGPDLGAGILTVTVSE